MFERGFKSWCENISLQIRKELGMRDTSPLDPRSLAMHLEVRIWTPADIKGLSNQATSVLLETEKSSWSAVTVSHMGKDVIVFNPRHSLGRRSSDLMHELAHLVIGYEPSTVFLSPDGQLALISFDRTREEEANWLSGCLLIPRPALISVLENRIEPEAACKKYFVSDEMLNCRMDVTGVRLQMKRRKRH